MKKTLVLAAASACLLAAAPVQASITVVTPGNMDGWAFYSTDSSGVVGTGTAITGMVNGPATPPLGIGSAHLETGPGAGDGSAQLRNSNWAGTLLSSLTTLSYSIYVTSWNLQQVPYLQLYLDLNGHGSYDDRLIFEPAYSSARAGEVNPYTPQKNVALNTWQTWNFLNGMMYSSAGFGGTGANAQSFAAYLALHPTATIVNDNGQGIGGIR